MKLKPIDKIDNLEDAMFYASSGVGAAPANCPGAIESYINAQTFITQLMAHEDQSEPMLAVYLEDAKMQLRAADAACDASKA